jgi:hypothetical protein
MHCTLSYYLAYLLLNAPYGKVPEDWRILEMPNNRESVHAPKLRELGFTPVNKELTLMIRAQLPRKMSRNERRLLKKRRYRPWFSATDFMTNATDETGQTWNIMLRVDLTSLGFEDKSSMVEAGLKKIRNSDTNYN